MDKYTDNLGSFSEIDPKVNSEKVHDYVTWKRSRLRRPLYQLALRYHWRWWYMRRVDNRWFMTPWYWLMELVMRNTQCDNMRSTLNRIELIRAGLELGQYQRPYNYG